MPFRFSNPNTSSNHRRTNPLSIPERFSIVPLLRSKTLPTKSWLREGYVTDFGLMIKATRCSLCLARRTALRTKRRVPTTKISSK